MLADGVPPHRKKMPLLCRVGWGNSKVFYCIKILKFIIFGYKIYQFLKSINPLTSPGEGATVFTSPYLSAGAPALGEAKGLIIT